MSCFEVKEKTLVVFVGKENPLCRYAPNKSTFTHLFVILVDVSVSELFSAQLTLVRLVLAVNDLVSRHLVQALERSTADLTGIRPLL